MPITGKPTNVSGKPSDVTSKDLITLIYPSKIKTVSHSPIRKASLDDGEKMLKICETHTHTIRHASCASGWGR